MNEVKLIKGDCLIEMNNIPDKSIDMILCDLPYEVLHKNNPHARAKKKINNKAHDVLYHNLYCKSYDEYWLKTHGLWPLDCKTFLEEEFNADLTI